MRFLVFSDSHGKTLHLKNAMHCHNEADAIIFLGDGIQSVKNILSSSDKPYYIVRGNCDIGSNEKDLFFIECNNHKIMFCHGHRYHVKYGLEQLISTAKINLCDIVLFGHTHIPLAKYIDNIYLLNPGTISQSPTPSYGILDITEKGVIVSTATIQ